MALAQFIATRFAPWASRFFRFWQRSGLARQLRRWLPPAVWRRKASDPRHALGRRGEAIACRFLRGRGYKVLYRNYRAPHGGELDITCRHGDVLVFVEVKTRASDLHGRPADAVNALKRKQITQGARAWLRLLDNPDIPYRFDIVEIIAAPGKPPVCNVVEGAFTLPERFIY